MSTAPLTYRYIERDLLETRFDYCYTPFEGPSLLRVFLMHRRSLRNDLEVLCSESAKDGCWDVAFGQRIQQAFLGRPTAGILPQACSRNLAVLPAQPGDSEFETLSLLLDLWQVSLFMPDQAASAVQPWMDVLLRKFEVSKRLFSNYSSNLKPVSADCARLDNYALLAALLMYRYEQVADLRLLNATLKLLDLLVSVGVRRLGLLGLWATLSGVEAELRAVEKLLTEQEVSL